MSQPNTAKHFVLQLGSLITLFITLGFFLTLLFSIITLQFPDAADGIWEIEGAESMLRTSFAMVIVFFPTYLGLTRAINKLRRKEKHATYTGVTKWLIYLALLAAGLVLLGDLVAVIMSYLEGDITLRFVLKALAVLLVVGSAFSYYLLDAMGYWLKHEKLSIWYGIKITVLIVLGLGYALTFIDSPSEVRAARIDQNQIYDLQNIQWSIQNYIATNSQVPENLEAIAESTTLPVAPSERTPYRYEKTDSGFALCATFSKDSLPVDNSFAIPLDKEAIIRNPDNWSYTAGESCFERTVNLTTDTE